MFTRESDMAKKENDMSLELNNKFNLITMNKAVTITRSWSWGYSTWHILFVANQQLELEISIAILQ